MKQTLLAVALGGLLGGALGFGSFYVYAKMNRNYLAA
jgi:formate/nitrite transporter FocA (FNT family)